MEAKLKQKDYLVHCDVCNVNITSKNIARHRKRNVHLFRLRKILK